MRQTKSIQARCGQRGFSIVEMMIAITVIVTGVLTAFSSQFSSLRVVHTSRDTNTAMSDLQNAMEGILTLPADEIPVPGGPYPQGQTIATFDDLHLNDERIVVDYPEYTAGAPVPNPLRIELTIFWTDSRGMSRSLQLTSMKSR